MEATHWGPIQTRSLNTQEQKRKLGAWMGREKTPMNEWGTLPKGIKLFLYLWERVLGCLEHQNPNRPSENETIHELAYMILNLMSHDYSITLVTFLSYP